MKTKIVSIVLAFVLLSISLATGVNAIDGIDINKKADLTVIFAPEGEGAEINFYLHKIADVEETAEYKVVDRFKGYDIDLEDNTAEEWRLLATYLTGVISADGISADHFVKTDSEGRAVFSGLPLGLYYVSGEVYHGDRVYVTPTPFLISLPDRDATGEGWDYNVELYSKYSSVPDSEPVSVEVLKIWNDNNDASRPEKVEISLYDGEKLYDTVVLNKDNNWQHKWTELYGGTVWSVKETSVPDGDSVSVEQQNRRFVITNTKTVPSVPSGPSLPQTGVMWRPVPILAFLGTGLVIAGVLRRRG